MLTCLDLPRQGFCRNPKKIFPKQIHGVTGTTTAGKQLCDAMARFAGANCPSHSPSIVTKVAYKAAHLRHSGESVVRNCSPISLFVRCVAPSWRRSSFSCSHLQGLTCAHWEVNTMRAGINTFRIPGDYSTYMYSY